MFRWIPRKPIDYDCHWCNGTGRIHRVNPPVSYDCTSCNGTGIAGNPAIPVLIVFGAFVLMVVCVLWWLFS